MDLVGTKRYLKLAIGLICFAAAVVLRRVMRLIGLSPKQQLIILYYHGVSIQERRSFARQMEILARRACVVPCCYTGATLSSKLLVAITFDDAFKSVMENALPELSLRGFHSTIFVPSGFLGRRPEWEMPDGRTYDHEIVMTIEELKTLSPHVSVGSHGVSHLHLSKIDRNQARKEIISSRQSLERLIGREVQLFAPPYGDCDRSIIEICSAAGYRYIFTILPEPVDIEIDCIVRGRVKVDPSDGILEFFLKINGAYNWSASIRGVSRMSRYLG